MAEYSYKAHYNWRWVLELALQDLRTSHGVFHATTLPSSMLQVFHIPLALMKRYSLFRIEMLSPMTGEIHGVWISSPAIEHLDPKDALFSALNSHTRSSSIDSSIDSTFQAMPYSVLLPWDVDSSFDFSLPSIPALLKAPLGCGGNGLYFVTSKEDCIAIAKAHAHRALTTGNFLATLQRDYGRIPMWSLQSVVESLRVMGGHKCQIRVYIVLKEQHLYLYTGFEVRVPIWSTAEATCKEEVVSEALAFDIAMCEGTTARPYNQNREKKSTGRYTFEEIPELGHVEYIKVKEHIIEAFSLLKNNILEHTKDMLLFDCEEVHINQLAIAGVDILIDTTYKPWIVEMNNNPAMPSQNRDMSEDYQQHLREVMRKFVVFGLSEDDAADDVIGVEEAKGKHFHRIW